MNFIFKYQDFTQRCTAYSPSTVGHGFISVSKKLENQMLWFRENSRSKWRFYFRGCRGLFACWHPPPSLKLFIKWLTLFINHLTLFEAIFRRIVIIYHRWCFFWQQCRCQLLGLRSHPVISPLRNSSVIGSHSINSEVHIEMCENRKTKQSYTYLSQMALPPMS